MTKENKEKKRTVSVYLTEELAEKLFDHVKKTCGNVSWFVSKLIDDAISDDKNE